jgi:hypothetical protein
MEKFWKYVDSTQNKEFQHNSLQIAHLIAANNYKDNECKWDHIKIDVLYAPAFLIFFVNIGLKMAIEVETSS